MKTNKRAQHTKKEQQKLLKGRIIAHLGKALIVEDEQDRTARCKKRTQLQQPAVGDYVEWIKTEDDAGRVENVLEHGLSLLILTKLLLLLPLNLQ